MKNIEEPKTKLVGGWTTHLKNMLVKLEIFPKIGVKITNIWNHHLVKMSSWKMKQFTF